MSLNSYDIQKLSSQRLRFEMRIICGGIWQEYCDRKSREILLVYI